MTMIVVPWKDALGIDLRETVELDPSVADWLPVCITCHRRADSWADVIGVPASSIEDDEPECIIFVHRVCPAESRNATYRAEQKPDFGGGV